MGLPPSMAGFRINGFWLGFRDSFIPFLLIIIDAGALAFQRRIFREHPRGHTSEIIGTALFLFLCLRMKKEDGICYATDQKS